MSYKLVFLINPISGGGEGKRIFGFLPEIMNSFDVPREEWHGEYTSADDFEGQLRRLIPLSKRIIVVGGDGTMNQALHMVCEMGRFDVEVGIIPLGTGNDLSRAMNVWPNYSRKGILNTVRKLIKARPHSIDLWKVGEKRVMAAYFSVGMDARIARLFNRARKQNKIPFRGAWFNKLYYLYISAGVLRHKIPAETRVNYRRGTGEWKDFEIEGCVSYLVGNIPSYAGGACPFSRCGLADSRLQLLASPNLFAFATIVSTTFLGGLSRFIINTFFPVHEAMGVKIKIPKGEYVQLDGEDVTDEFSGQEVSIEWVGQAKILLLDPP